MIPEALPEALPDAQPIRPPIVVVAKVEARSPQQTSYAAQPISWR